MRRASFALKVLGIVVATLTQLALTRADIYTVRREGAGIVPDRSVDVSMDAETVEIVIGEESAETMATFVMRNHSAQAVDLLVAFPILGTSYDRSSDLNREFKVEMKSGRGDAGAFTPATVTWVPGRKRETRDDIYARPGPGDMADFTGNVVWPVRWSPGETKIIRLKYDGGMPKVLPGTNDLGSGSELRYIVSTGARWKGPIGHAEITVRFPPGGVRGGAGVAYSDRAARRWSYPASAKWQGRETVRWEFENWTPTDEIWIRAVDWWGLGTDSGYYRMWLPKYEGSTIRYTPDYLDQLLDRELALGREYLPEQVWQQDLGSLNTAIADWLKHEIQARNGDPFVILDPTPAERAGQGTIRENNDGNIYSLWRFKFPRAFLGWYQPKPVVGGKAPLVTLSAIEQANMAFLEEVLTGLRKPSVAR